MLFDKLGGKPTDSKITKSLMRDYKNSSDLAWSKYLKSEVYQTKPTELNRRTLKAFKKRHRIQSPLPYPFKLLSYQLIVTSGLYPTKENANLPKNTAERIRLRSEHARIIQLADNPQEAIGVVFLFVGQVLDEVAKLLGSNYFGEAQGLLFPLKIKDFIGSTTNLASHITNPAKLHARQPYGLFDDLYNQIDQNLLNHLGYDPQQGWPATRTLSQELKKIGQSSLPHKETLTFFKATPLQTFFKSNISIALSDDLRREHTHFLAPSGTGKTRTLEFFINQDLKEVAKGNRSVIVIESEATLTRRLARLKVFDETQPDNLADRLFFIDPSLPNCLPTFNFFGLTNKPFKEMNPLEREQASNITLDLYQYIFRALRGGELTEGQGYIFNYLVRLLVWVEGASLDTLLLCLKDTDEAVRLSTQAPKRIQEFFRSTYQEKRLAPRRAELYQRLDSFVSGADTFYNMVSGQKNNLDLLEAIDRGSVILINTSKKSMGSINSEIFGRFMIALLRLVSFNRSEDDTLCICYLDEFQEYIDEKSKELFEQARKRSIALVVAHQQLKQLNNAELREAVQTNTQSIFFGHGKYNDRVEMARNMNTTPDFFQSLEKIDRVSTEFGFWGRGVTPNGAIKLSVPLGTLEKVGLRKKYPKGRWQQADKEPKEPQKTSEEIANLSPWTKPKTGA